MHEDGLKSPAAQVTGVESPFGTGGHLPGGTEALSAPWPYGTAPLPCAVPLRICRP